MPIARDEITLFRRMFLAHAPPHQAWMQDPSAPHKYLKRFHPITDGEIARHLVGTLTLAAPLIGRSPSGPDLALAAALDIDTGGETAIHRVLAGAAHHDVVAFGIASSGGACGHNGGHVWLLFDVAAASERLRQIAGHLADAAGISAETYPTRKTLRLPLGVHRWTGLRGRLLLPDGTTTDLDRGRPAVIRALLQIAALPRNSTDRLVGLADPPAPDRSIMVHPCRSAPRRQRVSIEAYNQATDLIALLERYGGRVAAHHTGGGALMHCPCPHHTHGDRTPSLEVKPATSSRYGRSVAHGYAPTCCFYTEPGQVVDAFAVFCRMEQLTPAAAMHALAGGRVSGTARSVRRSQAQPGPDLLAVVSDGGAR